VASAEEAFKGWRNTTVLHRQQIMFRFVQLIKDNMDRLAASITLEQGKTFADARVMSCVACRLPRPPLAPLSCSRARCSRWPRTWRRGPTVSLLVLLPPSAPLVSDSGPT